MQHFFTQQVLLAPQSAQTAASTAKRKLKKKAALACCVTGLAATGVAQTTQSIQVVPALNVYTNLGVNVHMEYTDGNYANVQQVLSDLYYLKISRVRDAVPQPGVWLPTGQGIAAMDTLAAGGIRFDLIVPATTTLSEDLDQMQALDAVKLLTGSNAGAIESVEGPNEINNAPVVVAGMTNEQAATSFQQQLYAAVHGDSSLGHIPVLYFTGGTQVNLAATTGLADVANSHPYPQNGDQPAAWLLQGWTQNFSNPLGSPWRITETGYYTDPTSSSWGGVDATTQAKLTMNIIMDAAQMGVQVTYLYQLLDPYPYNDPRGEGADGNLGLFYYDGSPKPVATAIRNLRTALFGGSAPSPSVSATVTGLPSTGHALAMPQPNGSVLVALWNEVPAWNNTTHQALDPAPVPVTVQIHGGNSATVLDPVTGDTTAVTRGTGGFPVDVPDSVVLLVVSPAN